jgi:hypothetical protein
MRWPTKETNRDGVRRVRRRFAWRPVRCAGGLTVWLGWVWVQEVCRDRHGEIRDSWRLAGRVMDRGMRRALQKPTWEVESRHAFPPARVGG